MRHLILIVAFLIVTPSIAVADCALESGTITANLKLDYQEFDQTKGKGWRSFAESGCFLEAAILLDLYNLHHIGSLLDWQERVVYWHSGQMYAMNDDYELAIERLSDAINPDQAPDDTFKWNAYARATIAFLKGDKAELLRQREELRKATDPSAKINLKFVDNMVDCFGQKYRDVYSTTCSK